MPPALVIVLSVLGTLITLLVLVAGIGVWRGKTDANASANGVALGKLETALAEGFKDTNRRFNQVEERLVPLASYASDRDRLEREVARLADGFAKLTERVVAVETRARAPRSRETR